MTPANTPEAELEVSKPLVRSLLREQHPDLADESLQFVATGWDNAIYRLGSDLAVRLPRRAMGAELVENEQRWLPRLAPRLPLPIPAPVRVGEPSSAYPWKWSIVAWQDGTSALADKPTEPIQAARELGRFVSALHAPAPVDAPRNPWRGIPLTERQSIFEANLASLADDPRLPAAVVIERAWTEAVATPAWPGPNVWIHGDLHPGNLIINAGTISAVIDFGDMCGGDPACDLMVGWTMFEGAARDAFFDDSGANAATINRSRGWAIAHGLAVLDHSADNPLYAEMSARSIRAATT